MRSAAARRLHRSRQLFAATRARPGGKCLSSGRLSFAASQGRRGIEERIPMDSSQVAGRRPQAIGASVAAALAALLVGCTTTPQLDAQWSDPSFGASFLRGARVLVACDAFEVVIRQICQDQLASEVG